MIGAARRARCAVDQCHRRMGGVLAVEPPQATYLELAVCSDHGDAIDSGAPFRLEGATIVMGDACTDANAQQLRAVWDRLSP
jgi:hypothetical protein